MPAAVCRTVAMVRSGDEIQVWGDGERHARIHLDEFVEGTVRLLRSNFAGPVNIGSEEMVTINRLVDSLADIAGKRIGKTHIPEPPGVRGCNSDDRRIREKLHWEPGQSLVVRLEATYRRTETHVSNNAPHGRRTHLRELYNP